MFISITKVAPNSTGYFADVETGITGDVGKTFGLVVGASAVPEGVPPT